MVKFQGQCKIDGMGMNNGFSICLCKEVDGEMGLNIVFDIFPLAKNDGKGMAAKESLLDQRSSRMKSVLWFAKLGNSMFAK